MYRFRKSNTEQRRTADLFNKAGIGNSILSIEWKNSSASAFCRDDDKATIIVYNATKQKFVSFKDVAQRADRVVDLQLPANFAGDVVHTWMYYVNTTGDAVSTSIYVGGDNNINLVG